MEVSLWEVRPNEWFFINKEDIVTVPIASSAIAIEGIDVLNINLEDLSLQFKNYMSNRDNVGEDEDIEYDLEQFFDSKGFSGLDIYFLDEFADIEDLLIYFYEDTQRLFSNLSKEDTFEGYVWERGSETEYIGEPELYSNPIELTLNEDVIYLNELTEVYKVEKKNSKEITDLYVIRVSSNWMNTHDLGLLLTKKEIEEYLLKMNYNVEVCLEKILNIGKVHN